eukprot:911309-Rhodomonas_salina.1
MPTCPTLYSANQTDCGGANSRFSTTNCHRFAFLGPSRVRVGVQHPSPNSQGDMAGDMALKT